MDGTIKSVIIGAVIIATIAVVIAMAATYWYYIAGVVAVGLVIWAIKKKAQDKANQV